jgi:hypothetical protein
VALSICFLICFVCASSAQATRHAMIVSVRAGDQQQSDINRDYCVQTRALFESAGFDRIRIFFEGAALEGSEDATAVAILEGLKQEASTLGSEDEFWLVLYGYASKSTRGVTLATSGKRLSGAQLAEALDAIKAPQCVLALNQGSAALMKPLCTRSDRRVLTAASSDGQLNPPLLPEQLFAVWQTNLTADCCTVFEEAAKQTEAAYMEQRLAVAEVSQFFDGNDIDVYPFEQATASSTCWSLADPRALADSERERVVVATPSSAKATEPSRLGKIDFSEFDALRIASRQKEMQTATEESLQLITGAKQQAPAHKGFPAFITRLNQRLVVNMDESTVLEKQSQIYLLDDVAAEIYGHIMLDDHPPHQTLEIKTARIIYPDGRFLELKPKTINNPDQHVRYHSLKFPGAKAGCLIDLDLNETERADSTLPGINQVFSLQKSIPVSSARITLEYPKTRPCYKLYGINAQPVDSTGEYSQKLVFDLGSLPALEHLPYDPPLNDFAIRLVASSLESWDSFREWVDQIMKESDVLDDAAKEKVAELTEFAKTDAEKVKAFYEFLCELRYETTPIGARAFRPRLPGEVCTSLNGDCKDKANALVAMARSVGVTGYMALVNRTSTTDESFPSWQFNHAVAYFPNLPGFPEGLWCDATDGSTPFASLPPGDIGRSALVLQDDKTVFKTIQLPNPDVNILEQDWCLVVEADGTVQGAIQFKARGLSDYYLRQSLKRCSPQQARYKVQNMINLRATGLSVETVEISALANLSAPLQVTAHCSGSDWALVRASLSAPYNLWNAVAVQHRNRELMLNDGQPLMISQIIRVKGDPATPSVMKWKKATDLAGMEVVYESSNGGWERRSQLDLTQPCVAPEAYADFQAQVSGWNAALKHHLTDQKQGAK